MLLTLHIKKDAPGVYTAHISSDRSEIGEFQAGTIASAIREAAQSQSSGVSGWHIWYEHVSIGTRAIVAMKHDAETLAQRLMVMHGQFFS